MSETCKDCGYIAKSGPILESHRKFQHEGADPVTEQPVLVPDPNGMATPRKQRPKSRARKAPAEPAEPAKPATPSGAPLVSPKRSKRAAKVAEPEPIHPTREAWMLAAVDAMRPWYAEAGLAPVPEVRISVGWAGGRGSKKGVRGQCWASHTTSDKRPAIFVTPDQEDPLTILGIVLHEMNHASDDGVSGHRGVFAKNAEALGFLKPWTSSDGKTDGLRERLAALLPTLGTFPHGAITDRTHGLTGLLGGPGGAPVQSTRMLKVTCTGCGCILRMTQKWINEAGLPTCGCGGEMVQEAGDATLARLLGI